MSSKSADSSHSAYAPAEAPKNFTSNPGLSTPTVTVPSICTASSISTASKFVVPSISAFPDISNVAASNSPDKVISVAPVIAPLNATAPLMSIVVAAICTSVSATKSN